MISIIVPVYNAMHYLEECVNSLLGQTYGDIEIILVNDGSSDDSGKLCDDYSNIDSRVQTIHKVNGGEADARNTGIRHASGDFIGFVDADDWIESRMYEQLLSTLLAEQCDVICCSNTEVIGEIERPFRTHQFVGITSGERAVEIILSGEYNPAVWCKLFRRSAVFDSTNQPIPFKNYKCGTDLVWVIDVLSNANRVYFDDSQLIHYRILEGSASRTVNLSQNRLDELQAWAEVVDKTRELKGKSHEMALSGFYSHFRSVQKIARSSKMSGDLERFEEFMKSFDFILSAKKAYIKRRFAALLR